MLKSQARASSLNLNQAYLSVRLLLLLRETQLYFYDAIVFHRFYCFVSPLMVDQTYGYQGMPAVIPHSSSPSIHILKLYINSAALAEQTIISSHRCDFPRLTTPF